MYLEKIVNKIYASSMIWPQIIFTTSIFVIPVHTSPSLFLLTLFFHLSVFTLCYVFRLSCRTFLLWNNHKFTVTHVQYKKLTFFLNHLKISYWPDAPSLYKCLLLHNHNTANKIDPSPYHSHNWKPKVNTEPVLPFLSLLTRQYNCKNNQQDKFQWHCLTVKHMFLEVILEYLLLYPTLFPKEVL